MIKLIIIKKTEIREICSIYDHLGFCSDIDCFECENADYRLINEDGVILKDFKFPNLEGKISKYSIEVFDEVDFNNFVAYLNNDNSDYRLTKIYCHENGEENVIIVPSKEDKRKEKSIRYEESLKSLLGEEGYHKLREERLKREEIELTLYQKILNKIKSTNLYKNKETKKYIKKFCNDWKNF